jgi:hypothetical protein
VLVFQLPSHHESQVEAEIKAMPDEAYRGRIAPVSAVPASVAASDAFAVTLKVRNTSGHTWRQPNVGPLALGNHWLDAAGELMVVQDDGRSPLLQEVPADFEWPVLLTMKAPADPGTYVVEIDLVHEGVSWFAHKGSAPWRFAIEVTREAAAVDRPRAAMIKEFPIPPYPEEVLPPPPAAAPESLAKADFPMAGVPRDQVMALIREHGARLAYLEEDRRAGPEWVSYRYFVVGGP